MRGSHSISLRRIYMFSTNYRFEGTITLCSASFVVAVEHNLKQ
ncbi:hypothetical protein Plhal304r1_c045g0125511 [Plasmopara halstedii]